jgi:rare lipoprotein A (peptidoglycan hydrolase)
MTAFNPGQSPPPVRTPTRIGQTVPAHRALIAGVLVALFSLLTVPAGASTTSSAASLRAQRAVLVRRIAGLTDEVDRAQAAVVSAEHRRAMSQAALAVVRAKFARHAVDAYIDGVQANEDEQLRRKVWAGTLSSTDRRVLLELRAAKKAAITDEERASVAAEGALRARAVLEASRQKLEQTIAEHARAAQSTLRAAAMTSTPTRAPRHARATGSQSELMRRYRFGPGGIPTGLVASGQVLQGKASWYGPGFDGRPTASGAIFDQEGWTVAHKTLPLGTILLVSYNGRSVVVLVNDRGPYAGGRILDLSHGVATALGTVHAGVAYVRAEILVPA